MAVSKLTNLDCYAEIKRVSVSGIYAKVNLVLTALKKTEVALPLKIKIKSVESEETQDYDDIFYWLNFYEAESYEVRSKNVDIGFYKSIDLKIDITNNNSASFKNNRWLRKIKVLIYNNEEVTYTSETLTLISGEIYLPTVTNIVANYFNTDEDSAIEELYVKFSYDFGKNKDVELSKTFFDYKIKVIDSFSGKIIHEKLIDENDGDDLDPGFGFVEYRFSSYKLSAPLLIKVELVSKLGVILRQYSEYLILYKPKSKIFTKINGKIREMIGLYTSAVNGESIDVDTFYENLPGVDVK